MPENKTRLQALFEVLPNIDMDDDGYPWFCIEAYDNTQKMNDHHDDCLNGCKACKKRFWEEIIPDQKEESSVLHAIIDSLEDRLDKLEKKVSNEALIFREVSKRNQKRTENSQTESLHWRHTQSNQ